MKAMHGIFILPRYKYESYAWNIYTTSLKDGTEKTEPKKRTRQIPFGFKQSDLTHQDYIEPVKEELEALDQAKRTIFKKTCSYRETAQWLHRKTGRYISHVGLRKRVTRRYYLRNRSEKANRKPNGQSNRF